MRIERTAGTRRWTPTATTLAMFALLCAAIAYWTLQLLAPAIPIAPAGSLADQRDTPDLAAAARLFGLPAGSGGAPSAVAQSAIQVLGVAASDLRGSAVLVVDGKPPRAFMVGDAVSADTRLVAVHSGAVTIERNGARIELPAPQRPSVATLWAGPARAAASTTGAAAPPVPAAAPAPAAAAAAPSGPPASALPAPAPGPLDLRTPGAATAAPSAANPPAEQPGMPGAVLQGQPVPPSTGEAEQQR